MSSVHSQSAPVSAAGLGAIIVLFGLLAFASHGNELLKQWVIVPGSTAELGIAADCRADELEEENLSLQECQLLVSNVQIQLASSPSWLRPLLLVVSSTGMLVSLASLGVGFAFVHGRVKVVRAGIACFAVLLALDAIAMVAAASTGPLLRAQYLWPLLLWLFIHLSLLLVNWHYVHEESRDQNE